MGEQHEHCAVVARDEGEDLAGTAATARGFVVVEHDGPWMPRAPGATELGPAAARLDAHPDVRLQLARPVRLPHDPDAVPRRHEHGRDAARRVLLAHVGPDPATRWLRRLEVPDATALLDLDPAVAAEPDPPPLGEPVEGPVWLVCAHGRRDACCARWGRPVALALALAGHDVWETTHTGGHRFAGTAVVLPHGLALGRLDPDAAVEAATGVAAGRADPVLLRGWTALPRVAQAADVALRRRLGAQRLDEVRVLDVDAGGPATAVTLDAGGVRWVAEVTTRPVAAPRPVSDGADPTTPDEHTVVLRRAP